MTAVFASVFFTVVLGGASASLLASLDEARRFFAPAERAPRFAAPVVVRRRSAVRLPVRSALASAPLRVAA